MERLLTLTILTITISYLSLSGGLLLLQKSPYLKKYQSFTTLLSVLLLFILLNFDFIPQTLSITSFPLWQTVILILSGTLVFSIINTVANRSYYQRIQFRLKRNSTPLIMSFIDLIDYLIDGMLLGIAFSFGSGILTATALLAYKIPREIGDFSAMKQKNISDKNILKNRQILAIFTILSALVSYILAFTYQKYLSIILSFVIGLLIYLIFSQVNTIIRSKREREK